MQHLDEGTIHAWLDGALADEEAAGVATHVAECHDCASMVAEARGMIAAAGQIISSLDRVRGGVIPTPTPALSGQRSLWRRLRVTPTRAALAATLLIAVASLLTVRRAPRASVAESVITAAPRMPRVAASEAPAIVSRQQALAARKATATRLSDTSLATQSPDARSQTAERVVNAVAPNPAQSAANAPHPVAEGVAGVVADRALPRAAAATAAAQTSPVSPPAGGMQVSKATADARAAAPERASSALQPRGAGVAGAVSAKSLAETNEFDGCYQIRADSASSAAFAGFPPRFALVNTTGGAPNAVRSVSAEGRIDSVILGGTWRRLTPEIVRLDFANAPEQQSLILQLAAGKVTGRASVGNRITNLLVARIECRR